MSNQWLRLWHDMPNDPKWRTISRASGQPVSLVIACYIHLLVDASRNVTRGHVTVTHEDLASALDVTIDVISSVIEAMQGRVMEGDFLSGWESRQVKREDTGNPETGARSASQRKRDQREREKFSEVEKPVTQCHEASRNVTLDKIREEVNNKGVPRFDAQAHLVGLGVDPAISMDWIKMRKGKRAEVTKTAIDGLQREAMKAGFSLDAALRECCSRGWSGFKAEWVAGIAAMQVVPARAGAL